MVVGQHSAPSSETRAESHPPLSRAHPSFKLAFEVLRLPTNYDYDTLNYVCNLQTTPTPFDLCLRPALPLRRTPTRSAKSLEVPFSRPTLGRDSCARAQIALRLRVVEPAPLLPFLRFYKKSECSDGPKQSCDTVPRKSSEVVTLSELSQLQALTHNSFSEKQQLTLFFAPPS
ncbi:uncharacterized protein FIBRA_09193 [Fibroporia radiculosa]|uniref:Uncharacterized protein n=1 Tax=Fibroporia radiculosa TaxID=599839 RepID=J7S634_9APHY|nr:uncharacterized protein FIBRA_09193 [Fibroporia radiculosa]CCM06884.1 predicted protein [Fibroporia radiculosa]